MVHKHLAEMLLEFGLVKNVALKLLELHMTLNYSVKITVDAKDKNNAIFDSVNTDNEFYHKDANDKVSDGNPRQFDKQR